MFSCELGLLVAEVGITPMPPRRTLLPWCVPRGRKWWFRAVRGIIHRPTRTLVYPLFLSLPRAELADGRDGKKATSQRLTSQTQSRCGPTCSYCFFHETCPVQMPLRQKQDDNRCYHARYQWSPLFSSPNNPEDRSWEISCCQFKLAMQTAAQPV